MKLLFVTGSRGEWGYIRPIIKLCQERGVNYSICATNMLLLPGHGVLIDEIRKDGYMVDDEIFMSLDGDNHIAMTKSLAVFMTSFVDTVNRVKPTWIVLAGDRGEQLMAAIAGAYTYTPVCHIQAGERSGNIDGVARHAIGKCVHLHFAANQDAAERLIRLGEEPFRVHTVGAPQIDELVEADYTEAKELTERYGLDVASPFLLCVQHPVTEEMDHAAEQARTTIKALSQFAMPKVWILPNNDAGSQVARRTLIDERGPDMLVFDNLTRRDYLGLLRYCSCIVGNSSSALLEAPTFRIAGVNIGRRQADRVCGSNVIHVGFDSDLIFAAVEKALSPDFQKTLASCENPYGDGRSAQRILDTLSDTPLNETLLVKRLTY